MERGVSVVVAAALIALVATVGAGCKRRRAPRGRVASIVTLTPSATEIVAALGAGDRLVGVDDYSTYPPSVASLPRVGSFLKPSFEAIVRLDPDLVIADDIHGEAAGALSGVGIEVVQAPMHALPDLERAFTTIGERLDLAGPARAAVDGIERDIEAVRARRRGRDLRVLVVIDRQHGSLDNMIGAADGSWLDELLAITGAANVLAGSAVRYPKLSPEVILMARPDVILDASYSADPATALDEWRALPGVPAVDRGRVRVLTAPYFRGPSPRVGEALTALEAALAP